MFFFVPLNPAGICMYYIYPAHFNRILLHIAFISRDKSPVPNLVRTYIRMRDVLHSHLPVEFHIHYNHVISANFARHVYTRAANCLLPPENFVYLISILAY